MILDHILALLVMINEKGVQLSLKVGIDEMPGKEVKLHDQRGNFHPDPLNTVSSFQVRITGFSLKYFIKQI